MTDSETAPANPRSSRSRWIIVALLGMVALAVVPIIITWGGSDEPSPKPNPTLSPVAAPPGEPIAIAEFGRTTLESDRYGMISFGAVFANSSDSAAFNTQVEITAYDLSGVPLPDGKWEQWIRQIPAGGKAYMAGVVMDLEMPWKIDAVADLRFTIGGSSWRRDTDPRSAPEASDVTVSPGKSPFATVEFRPPAGLDMQDTPVWVLFRDSGGAIVGGCANPAFGAEALEDGRYRLSNCARPDTAGDAIEVHLELPDRFTTPSPGVS